MSETPLTVHAVDAEISPGLQHSRDALHHALLGDRQLRHKGKEFQKDTCRIAGLDFKCHG